MEHAGGEAEEDGVYDKPDGEEHDCAEPATVAHAPR